MAVASFNQDGQAPILRGFDAPKAATVTHWYRAAAAQIDKAPDWRTVDMGAAVVDEDVIHYTGGEGAGQWDLFIARKRNLK